MMINLLSLKRISSLNLLPLFPFFKILTLVAIYIVFKDDVIFTYTTSFIAVAFLVRLLIGNPYSFTRKYLDNQALLQTYYLLNIIFVFAVILFLVLAQPENKLFIMTLVLCIKVLEAVISSILFERNLKNKTNTLLRKVLTVVLLFNIAIFAVLVRTHGLMVALVFDLTILNLVSLYLLRHKLAHIRNAQLNNIRTVLGSNYEIALTVLPVSVFVLYYSQNTELIMLGYITLAFSFAGFLNRPLSFVISSIKKISYRHLSNASHILSLILLLLVVSSQNTNTHFLYYLISMIMLFTIVIQNTVRLHAYSTTKLTLVRYHLIEVSLVALSFLFSEFLISLCILIITRTVRLYLIRKYE